MKSKKEDKKKKRVTSVISFVVGILIFLGIFWAMGPESIEVVKNNANWILLIPAFAFGAASVFVRAYKLRLLLKSHGHKVNFFKVLKYDIAGFSISYLTPSAKVGGEPLKAYMLKKEQNIPLKTSGSTVTIDKFVELMGVIITGLVGFFMLLFLPEISSSTKTTLLSVLLIASAFLFFVYYWTVKGKGPFTTLFNLLRFYKIKKFKKFGSFIKKLETRMKKFFVKKKKAFFFSLLVYLLFIFFQVMEFKFILMAIGFDATMFESVLAIVVFGIAGLIPVPGGLGFQEAGHSGLFAVLRDSGGVGLVFSLIVRIRYLAVAGIGFTIITHFSSNEIVEKFKKLKSR